MEKKISIRENENNYLQKVCFEYESVVKLIKYLMRLNTPIEKIENYIPVAIEKFTIMELAKNEVLNKYLSPEVKGYEVIFEESVVLTKI